MDIGEGSKYTPVDGVVVYVSSGPVWDEEDYNLRFSFYTVSDMSVDRFNIKRSKAIS